MHREWLCYGSTKCTLVHIRLLIETIIFIYVIYSALSAGENNDSSAFQFLITTHDDDIAMRLSVSMSGV